jgi:hypothetical protein
MVQVPHSTVTIMDTSALELCILPKALQAHLPSVGGTGREAATPKAMMSAVWASQRSLLGESEADSLCFSCPERCGHSQTVPMLLARAREILSTPLPKRRGEGRWVTIAPDSTDWSEAFGTYAKELKALTRHRCRNTGCSGSRRASLQKANGIRPTANRAQDRLLRKH